MLAPHVRAEREEFYRSVFGEKKFPAIVLFRPSLWEVSAYPEKIAGLLARGFTNPQKMITSSPTILGHSFDNIDAKIEGLRERGFSNPQKMIVSLHSILGLSFDNIDRKIAGLRERGFKDPQKIIASLPAILGYSFDNIDEKIAGLSARGFTNPQKMIASSPAILCYSSKNIDRKLKLCRRLRVDVVLFITWTVMFISMSSKHYVPIARALRKQGKEPTPTNVFRIYKNQTF